LFSAEDLLVVGHRESSRAGHGGRGAGAGERGAAGGAGTDARIHVRDDAARQGARVVEAGVTVSDGEESDILGDGAGTDAGVHVGRDAPQQGERGDAAGVTVPDGGEDESELVGVGVPTRRQTERDRGLLDLET